MSSRFTYHHVLKCADCPAGCIGVDPNGSGTIENNVGWASEAEAVRDHLEGCLSCLGVELDLSLASAPKAERKYRRTIRENIKRIKAALDDVERTIDYSTDWEFPPEAVQPLEFSPEIEQKLEFPPEVTQGLTMPPIQPLTFPSENL